MVDSSRIPGRDDGQIGPARPAPQPLDLVQRLVNTRNVMRGYDLLGGRGTEKQWLASAAPGAATGTDLADLIALREALRALLLSHTENRRPDASVVAAVRELSARAPLAATVTSDDMPTLEPAGRTNDLVAHVLSALVTAPRDAWSRLKVCANPDCRWAFYDSSRNRRGSWCDMNVCGSRAKMRIYRSRNTADTARRPPSRPGA